MDTSDQSMARDISISLLGFYYTKREDKLLEKVVMISSSAIFDFAAFSRLCCAVHTNAVSVKRKPQLSASHCCTAQYFPSLDNLSPWP